MKMREIMSQNNENLSWCIPYIGKSVSAVVCEGRLAGLVINGEEQECTRDNLHAAAQLANQDYSDYHGWGDLHILLDGDVKECSCRECPFFGVCDAMYEEF